jgi:hypothetical protein
VRVAAIAWTLLALVACKREGAGGAAAPAEPAPSAGEAATATDDSNDDGEPEPALAGLCLWMLEVEPRGPRGTMIIKSLRERLPGSGPFLGVGGPAAEAAEGATACPSTLPPAARVGLAVAVALDPVDDAGEPTTLERGTQLLLRARAHVERGDAAGRPQIAEANLEIPVPLPPDARERGLDALWGWRAVAAATMAAEDAAGQLVLRTASEATVRAAIDDEANWRRIAALREVGERSLRDERARIERLAGRSRPDLAAVAAATLGRLGDPRSVPALRQALASANVEVADAALFALLDIGDATARAALEEAARDHPQPWIRQRALMLLRSAPEPTPGAAARPGRTP